MIFFLSDRDTSKRTYFLYEMDHEGKQMRKITEFPLRDSWMSGRNNGDELIVNPHPEVDSVFYIINRQGAIISKIHHGLTFASDPAFSPDGSRIAFRGANQRSKRDPGFDEDLYLMNTDGSGLLRLTNYPETDTTAPWYAYRAGPPRWHPSGDFISYHSFQNGKYSLYAVSPDGTGSWKLTETQQQEGWHSWSPDGSFLAVELFDQNQSQFHIGLLDWESKALRILTDTTFKYQQAPLFVSLPPGR
jgi:TolB protein